MMKFISSHLSIPRFIAWKSLQKNVYAPLGWSLSLLLGVGLNLGSIPLVHAADFYWDADGSVVGQQNGNGTWTSQPPNLSWTSSIGGPLVPWVNGSESVAYVSSNSSYTNPNAGGVITLGENITLNQLNVGSQAGSYRINPGSGSYTLQFSGTAPQIRNDANADLILNVAVNSSSPLIKTGTGGLVLNESVTASGLQIHQGAVTTRKANLLPATANITLGDNTTAGTLNVQEDLTIGSLNFSSRSGSVTNQINLSKGVTLTVNGGLVNGIVDGTSNNNTTNSSISGNATLIINTTTGNLVVSSGNDATNSTSNQRLDLSGLKNFQSTTNNIYVGRSTTATSGFASSARPQSTLVLAENNKLTANTMLIGVGNQTTTNNFLELGLNNDIFVNTIVVGGSRSRGTVRFRSGVSNGNLVLRGSDGTSRVNIYLADSRNASGLTTSGGSSVPEGTMDFTGGTVDLLINDLIIAAGGTDNAGFNGGAYGRAIGRFTFGGRNSEVNINNLIIGLAVNVNEVAGTTPDPYLTTQGTFTMNDGSLVVNEKMILGLSNDGATGNQQNIESTFILNGGQALVNADIELGSHSSDGTGFISATMNLNGGKMTVNGDIYRGDELSTGVINLNGSHLDMNGNAIGDATLPVTLNLQSGELSNLGEFNAGDALIKSGTGLLYLSGVNTYTGETHVNAGQLIVRSTTALQNTSKVVVAGDAVFGFDDGVGGSTLTLPTTSGIALELKDGAFIGAQLGSATGSIVVQNGSTVQTDADATIFVNIYNPTGSAPPASSVLLSAESGGITSNNAEYQIGVVYNATNYTVSLNVTDTQIVANRTMTGTLLNAYWKGGFGLDDDTWSASNGSTISNWSPISDGSVDTGLVPGENTNVFFNATSSTLPTKTDLGANMTIRTLTVNTPSALTLDDEYHSLSIADQQALFVNNGAGAVNINTNLYLLHDAPVIHVDNAGGLTLTGTFHATNAFTLTKTGSGVLYLDPAFADYNARLRFFINGGTVAISSEEALGSNPLFFTSNQLRLNNATLRALQSFRIDDSNRGISIGSGGGTFEVDANQKLGIDNTINSSGTMTKTGQGELEITKVTTGSFDTVLKGGTLSLKGGTNTLPGSRIFTFESNSATLDIHNSSQSFSQLVTNTHTGSGAMNLFINGDGGTLTVNNTASRTLWGTSDSAKPLNLDMSGLSNFVLNATGQTFGIGLTASGTNPNGTTAVSTVHLAQNNTITATNIRLGEQTSSSGGGLSTLILGQTNVLNSNTIEVGAGRSSGTIRFDPTLVDPTLKIRGTNGTAAVTTFGLGRTNNFTNNNWYSTVDLTGGILDALITTLDVGVSVNRQGTLYSTFTMDRGEMTVTNLNIGNAQGTDVANPGQRNVYGVFNLIGNGTVKVTNLVIAKNTANVDHALADPNAYGTLNIEAGTVEVGAGGILLGQSDVTGYDSTATLNLTGGVLDVKSNIAEAATGSGNVNSTINLNGGTLNLNNNNIGTAARQIDNLLFIKGTLQNVKEINGGGAIAKTGSAHDTLILSGINTHTGTTTIKAGRYLVNGTHTGGANYLIENGATLGGNGAISLAANASFTFEANARLLVGDGEGAAQQLSLSTSGTGSVIFTDSSSLLTTRILSDTGAGGDDHSLDPTAADLLVVSGDVWLNGATLQVLDVNQIALGFTEGDVWRLFDWSNVSTDDFGVGTNQFGNYILPTLSDGLMWDVTDLYTTGTIVVTVPEPSKMVLFLIGTMLLFHRRQRRC